MVYITATVKEAQKDGRITKSYEKKYKALEDIVKQLDDGDMTISELLSQYKRA